MKITLVVEDSEAAPENISAIIEAALMTCLDVAGLRRLIRQGQDIAMETGDGSPPSEIIRDWFGKLRQEHIAAIVDGLLEGVVPDGD
jgi:hypothetical protein